MSFFGYQLMIICGEKDRLFEHVAPYIKEVEAENTKNGCTTTIALSGSSQPVLLSKLLTNTQICWSNVHFYFADERCVPLDNKDSNYYAWKKAFENAAIPKDNIHTINGNVPPEEAAFLYAKELRSLPLYNTFPRFDFIFLGVGPDGHICSLFPGFPQLEECTQWVTFIRNSPKPPSDRITLTLPVVNSARNVFVIATGSSKRPIIASALKGESSLPIARVNPHQGRMIWFLDNEAKPYIVCLAQVPLQTTASLLTINKHLNSLLLEHIQLCSFLNSIIRKLLLQVENLVSNHDLHFIGFKISHFL